MCTDCNTLTIPVGPTGAQGAQGPAGLNGALGADGSDGTTILSAYNSLTGITTSNNSELTVFTYSLPANTLLNNGDELEIFAYFDYSDNDSVTLRFKLGAKIVTSTLVGASPFKIFYKIKIARISQTSQLWTIESTYNNGTIIGLYSLLSDSSSVDSATILNLEISLQDTSVSGGSCTFRKGVIYKYSL